MRKYIVQLLIICIFIVQIICIFIVQIICMIYEFVNYNGFNILSQFYQVRCKFIICEGDLTTWYHFPMKIHYIVYSTISLIGTILSSIDHATRKQKISLIVLITWSTLLAINIVPIIVLLGQKYGLSLMLYYEIFITMQFLNLRCIIISILYIAYIAIFISYVINVIWIFQKRHVK